MDLSKQLLAEFVRTMERTRRLLERTPSEVMGFSPGHGLQSIGWNVSHLIETAAWPAGIIQLDELDMPAPDPAHAPRPETDKAALLRTFDANVAVGRAALEATNDGHLAGMWTLKMGGQTLFTMSRAECIREWVLNHTVHHSAILSVYLRMAGVKLSSIMEE